MKKVFALLLGSAILVSLLAGCGSARLVDGTYFGTTPASVRGHYGIVEVTVNRGKVTDVQFIEINGSNGLPKAAENGYTYQEALDAIEQLPGKFLAVQDIDKVDNITGATSTVDFFKTAMKSALAQAEKGYANVMRDGTYSLATGKDMRGNWAEAVVTITNGQFATVAYEEFAGSTGLPKSESNYSYEVAVTAIDELNAQMNNVKNLSQIDNITGATSTVDQFKSMVQFAMDMARARDGVYEYKSEPDVRGNWTEAKLVMHNGQITDFRFMEFLGSTNEPKTAENYNHEPAITLLWETSRQVVNNNYGVDFVTGATSSRDKLHDTLNLLLQEALR